MPGCCGAKAHPMDRFLNTKTAIEPGRQTYGFQQRPRLKKLTLVVDTTKLLLFAFATDCIFECVEMTL